MVIFSAVSATQIIYLGFTYIPLFNLHNCFKVVLTSLYSLMASQLCSAIILITSQSVITSERGTAVFCSSALENEGLWVWLGLGYARKRAYPIGRGSLKNGQTIILKEASN